MLFEKEGTYRTGAGLGLNVNIGGSLGNISAIEIIDIPAGQLKTDVS